MTKTLNQEDMDWLTKMRIAYTMFKANESSERPLPNRKVEELCDIIYDAYASRAVNADRYVSVNHFIMCVMDRANKEYGDQWATVPSYELMAKLKYNDPIFDKAMEMALSFPLEERLD